MRSEVTHEILKHSAGGQDARPSANEFEMAYQARVAIDRIRFAIKHAEQFVVPTDHTREAGVQLLDALQRLETIDRRFQERSRLGGWMCANAEPALQPPTESEGGLMDERMAFLRSHLQRDRFPRFSLAAPVDRVDVPVSTRPKKRSPNRLRRGTIESTSLPFEMGGNSLVYC